MHKTVVAVFDDQREAERARQEFLHSGYSYAGVVIHSGGGRSGSAMEGQSTVQEDHGGIGGWFRSLFNISEDDENVRLYAEAVRRGQCVLSVHVNDEDEADRAHRILQRYDAIDPEAPEEDVAGRPAGASAAVPAADPGASATSAGVTGAAGATDMAAWPPGRRGGVRVFTRVVEVRVERRPAIDPGLTDSDRADRDRTDRDR